MKININLNKTLKDSIKGRDGRTSVYVWKNLSHLKEFYKDVVDSETINNIADKIVMGQKKSNNKKYRKRAELTETLNESCLCNLVEMELLNREDVFDKFLEKPIEF